MIAVQHLNVFTSTQTWCWANMSQHKNVSLGSKKYRGVIIRFWQTEKLKCFQMHHRRHLFHWFLFLLILVFSNKQINVTKSPFSMRCWDSNPWQSELESPPMTTRLGFPPHLDQGCNVRSVMKSSVDACAFLEAKTTSYVLKRDSLLLKTQHAT